MRASGNQMKAVPEEDGHDLCCLELDKVILGFK